MASPLKLFSEIMSGNTASGRLININDHGTGGRRAGNGGQPCSNPLIGTYGERSFEHTGRRGTENGRSDRKS